MDIALLGAAASGLSASIDYYSIEIKDVISVVPGLSALSKCYNLDGSNPGYAVDNQFCQLLTRDANGLLQLIETPYLNLGGLKTEGVDLQLDWVIDLNDLWTLRFNTAVGYLLDFSVQTLPGSAFQDFTGTNTIAANHTVSNTFPEWKALTTVGVGFGPVNGLRALALQGCDGRRHISHHARDARSGCRDVQPVRLLRFLRLHVDLAVAPRRHEPDR